MATIPFQNFALTDPVAAQQAVQMAQILQAAQAEKDRNMGLFARGVQQQQTARENAAEQRAMTQAQMAQQSSELEKQRQARALETDKLIAAQRGNLTNQSAAQGEAEAYDFAAARIASEDPPTDSEFESLTARLSPELKLRLRDSLKSQRRTLTTVADRAKSLADYWNAQLKAIEPDPKKNPSVTSQLKDFRERLARDREATDLLRPDPTTGLLIPKYLGPRLDSAAAPTAAPPIGAIPSQVTPIQDLLGGITTRQTGPINYRPPEMPSIPNLGGTEPRYPTVRNFRMQQAPTVQANGLSTGLYNPDAYSTDIPLRQFSIPMDEYSVSNIPPSMRPTPFRIPEEQPNLYSPDAYQQRVGPRFPVDSDYAFPIPPLPRQSRMWNPDSLGYIPQPIPVPSLSGSLEGYPAYFLR